MTEEQQAIKIISEAIAQAANKRHNETLSKLNQFEKRLKQVTHNVNIVSEINFDSYYDMIQKNEHKINTVNNSVGELAVSVSQNKNSIKNNGKLIADLNKTVDDNMNEINTSISKLDSVSNDIFEIVKLLLVSVNDIKNNGCGGKGENKSDHFITKWSLDLKPILKPVTIIETTYKEVENEL